VGVLLLVLLVHALLILAIAGMHSMLHLRETSAPAGVGVVLFRWPGFGRPEAERKAAQLSPRTKASTPRPRAAPTAPAVQLSAATASTTPAPVPAAPPATGQLPAGLGRIIAEHARCYGFQLTDEERARCANRDVGREQNELPLNIPPQKVRTWEADQERRRAPPGPSVVPCPRETGGSNLGTGCLAHGSGVHVPLP
jgi:hypothetical protein